MLSMRHFFIASLALLAAVTLVYSTPGQSTPAKVKAQKSAEPATELPLIDLSGYNQILAKYKGKPLLVTFWATWCEPCRFEFPMMVELAKQYAPQGLAVFGVSLDDDADMSLVRRFLAKNQPPFPNYRQKPGIDVDAFYRGVNSKWDGTMPHTLFYNRDGSIAGYFVGAQTRPLFEQAIHVILASHSSGNLAARPAVAGQ